MDVFYQELRHGFEYGGAKIERWASDPKKGWVVLGLTTKKHPQGIQIYVTKTGKVKINGVTWKEAE